MATNEHDTDHGPCACGAWHQPEIPQPPSKDKIRLAERGRLLEQAEEKICDLKQRINDLEERLIERGAQLRKLKDNIREAVLSINDD